MAGNESRKGKRPSLGATVPPPNEKADFFSQLQNTFERGVVTAEIDLSGLINEKGGGGSVKTMWGEADRITTGPAGVHNQIIKKMKAIANTFGGSFNVHAPLQANPADLISVGRARSAELIKKSMDYTAELGGKTMTIHPIGQMEYYFVDPFVGTKVPLPNPFYLAGSEKELKGLMKDLGVRDPLLKKQIEKEWKNFVHTIPMTFAEKFSALAVQDLQDFSRPAGALKAGEVLKKYRDSPQRLAEEAERVAESLHPRVRDEFNKTLQIALGNEEFAKGLVKNMDGNANEAAKLWPRVAMASLDPIDADGSVVGIPPEFNKIIRKHQAGKKLTDEELKTAKRLEKQIISRRERVRIKAWNEVIAGPRGTRFGPFKQSQKEMHDAVVDTFRRIFESVKKDRKGGLYKALKKKKMQIGLENLFPAMPEKGYMQGYAYFYKPEQMAKLIKDVQKVAQENGFSKDVVGMTFDLAHAASAGIKPSKFLKDLKKEGIKPQHVHVVGGPGYGHGHIAWGDWLDEVSRMDPGIISKLADVGAINIEGGAGLYDVEVTVNTLWDKGMPLEAMMAIAGGPEATPGWGSYWSGEVPRSYFEGRAPAYVGTQLPVRSFYSFQNEMTPMPMQSAFGSYTAPAFVGGGYSVGPGRTSAFWSSAQPLLYSSKTEQ